MHVGNTHARLNPANQCGVIGIPVRMALLFTMNMPGNILFEFQTPQKTVLDIFKGNA